MNQTLLLCLAENVSATIKIGHLLVNLLVMIKGATYKASTLTPGRAREPDSPSVLERGRCCKASVHLSDSVTI